MFNERPRREVWMQMGGRAETQTGDSVMWALLVCVPFVPLPGLKVSRHTRRRLPLQRRTTEELRHVGIRSQSKGTTLTGDTDH
jgi:hypothetical protein